MKKEVYLFSYGGSGLKYLTKKILLYEKKFNNPFYVNYIKTHNPHLFAEKQEILKSKNNNAIGIAVYANPVDAFLSFWRRSGGSSKWINAHLNNICGTKHSQYIREDNIHSFLKNNNSFDILERWFDSYLTLENNIDILFVKYESLGLKNVQSMLCGTLDMKLKISDFGKRHDSRHILGLNQQENNQLNIMFKRLAGKQSLLPDIFLKEKGVKIK